ncbi:hypothetical protein [Spiroplasma endosymbiont of Othius punctulatus]|uniref:hypothetical protein n=1 Tax=Spiroplasma endosymbiont of Othius punctulatus TaxID=3066289 RepID=UPI0030D1E0B0
MKLLLSLTAITVVTTPVIGSFVNQNIENKSEILAENFEKDFQEYEITFSPSELILSKDKPFGDVRFSAKSSKVVLNYNPDGLYVLRNEDPYVLSILTTRKGTFYVQVYEGTGNNSGSGLLKVIRN